MIVKFCGLKTITDIEYCNELKPDFIGLIFAQSPRRIDFETARLLLDKKSEKVKSVGVFKNQPVCEVIEVAKSLEIDFVQLHGDESIDDVENLRSKGFRVIKAIEIENEADLERAKEFVDIADYILLDRPKGKQNDILPIAKKANFDFIIAGGITPENVERYLEVFPAGIDVSSGIETNGQKDFEKMKKIISKTREFLKVGEY